MKVLGQKTLWKGRFIKTLLITYRDRNGTVRDWEALGRVNCDGIVIVVPITKDNELILIRQYRPILDSYVIELPAGLMDQGEDAISAGRRELVEETGYASDDFMLLTEGVMSTGIDMDKWEIVLAREVKEVSEDISLAHPPDDNEDIETIKVPVDNVYETLETFRRRGDKIDLRIFGLLELAKRKMDTA